MQKRPAKNKLLALIIDNRDVAAPSRGIRSEKTADGADVIRMYDIIDPWYGASAEALAENLDGKGDVQLRLNSPGGDVFEAVAMAAVIAAHPGRIDCFIDGYAASSATRVALACASVSIADTGMVMIHESWTGLWGNKRDLLKTAALLDKIDAKIAFDYARKSGATAEAMLKQMEDETWFTADEALAAKLVDSIFKTTQSESGASDEAKNEWNLSAYKNAPKPKAPADEADAEEIARVQALNRNRLNLLMVA